MQRNGTAGVSWHEKLVLARKAVEAKAGNTSHSNRLPQVGSATCGSPPRRRRDCLRFSVGAAGIGVGEAEGSSPAASVRIAPKAHRLANNQNAHCQANA